MKRAISPKRGPFARPSGREPRIISFSSKVGLVALGFGIPFLACGKTSEDEANLTGSDKGGEAESAGSLGPSAGKAGVPSDTINLAVGGVVGNGGWAGSVAAVGGLPAQPTVDCGQAGNANAGAGGANEECASPPSVCADGQRLVYYASGVCVAGGCKWTEETLQCPEGCSHGGCVSSVTAK